MNIPPNSIPAVARPSAVPRRSANQLAIITPDGSQVEAPSPIPRIRLEIRSPSKVWERLAETSPTTTSAVPPPITYRASNRSSSQPANGDENPTESASRLVIHDAFSWLQWKLLMKESRKIGPVLNPPPHMKKSAMKRLIAIVHACRSCFVIAVSSAAFLPDHRGRASPALLSMAEFL